MDSTLQPCIICKKNNEEVPGVKQYISQDTVRRSAERRRSLSRDSFTTATQDILSTESSNDMYYHSTCHSRFCGVKRKVDEDANEPRPSLPSMRSKSDLPQSNKKGVLVHNCLFCPTVRKRIKSRSGDTSFEKLHKVETTESSSMLINAAKRNTSLRNSQRLLSLGSEDLVAIEAHYHNSCRLKFLREANELGESSTEGMGMSIRKQHEEVFKVFLKYIEDEIILKRIPKYGSRLMDLYKEQYKMTRGADENIDAYATQTLITKLKNAFGDRLTITHESKKEGNILYPEGMSFDEAKTHLKNLNTHDEEIRCAAMTLRSEILKMEKNKMPTPTSIHTLKECSPEVPPLTKLFYQTLLSGLAPNPGDGAQMKTLSLASDAVFATTRGSVRPWKNTSLGLGLSSMLGSKVAITILNRLSHTISYDECKRLETEIAYTCSSGKLETPAGLLLQRVLSTGTAWDNYDLNMETLDGKHGLHVTVGIAYQNVIQQQEMLEEEPVTPLPKNPIGSYRI